MSEKENNIWEKLGTLDPRIFYAIALVLMAYPLLRPLGLPITVGQSTKDFYDFIEDLPPESVVMIQAGIAPSAYPELAPGLKALIEHAFERDLKFVVWCGGTAAPPGWEKLLKIVGVPPDKTYGEDWVFLGFIAGGETANAGLASDTWATAPVDAYGNKMEDLPLMANLRMATDFAAYIDFTAAADNPEMIVRQWVAGYGVPYLTCVNMGMLATTMPYYPGQLVGALYGIRGGAEYELLIKKPWFGLAQTDALSTLNTFAILVIVLGNIGYFFTRKSSVKVK